MKYQTFLLTNTVKAKLPKGFNSLVFMSMKDAVLGKKYELSVIIVNKKEIQKLNKEFREINEPTDILSFPLSEDFGEIYINLDMTKKKAEEFEQTYENFLGYLFIHGLVHLKGFDHGSKMESVEARFRKKFGISD